ncbi:MAG: cobalt ECF transporter T component CbiQ [Candidatus Nanopelagicales bacterium]
MAGSHGRGVDAFYVEGATPLHRIAAHIKILAAFTFVLFVVLTPPNWFLAFALYAAVVIGLILYLKVPWRLIKTRLLLEIPFVVFALFLPFFGLPPKVEVLGLSLSEAGLIAGWNILAKATLGVLTTIVLSSTTKPKYFLLGLEKLKVPTLLVQIASFMIRYTVVVTEELRRMSVARESRCFEARGPKSWRVLARGLGVLFIRSYERGERVHLAMLSRGFSGSMPITNTQVVKTTDWMIGLLLPISALTILIWGWFWY